MRSRARAIAPRRPRRCASCRALDLPDHSLVLTNFYSEGFVPDVLGARGAIDGRAPYTEGTTLRKVNAELRHSIAFFASPPGVDPPLPVDGLTHVLIATGTGWSLGAGTRWTTDQEMLDHRPDLQLIASSPSYRLYAVSR